MVYWRRVDHILNRELPIYDGQINRRKTLRRRLFRDRPYSARRLFVDRDEIPGEIIRAFNEREELPLEFSFAPLSPLSLLTPSPLAIPAGTNSDEDFEESIEGYSDNISEASTIEVDLDNPNPRIPPGILLAWERNAEIQPLANVFTQTFPPLSSPGSPAQHSEYSYPSYSPISLVEFEGLVE